MLIILNKQYFFIFIIVTGYFFFAAQAKAGNLIIKNSSEKNITCYVGKYTNPIKVLGNSQLSISPKMISGMNWVECNGLKQRHIYLSSDSSNHWIIFNGQAKSVFNVFLYPYIPTYPQGDFSTLTKRLTEEFQALHPDVMVNIVISSEASLDPYTFANLPNLLGSDGYDAVELDSMLLGDVVRQGLASPVELASNKFWPAAYQAAIYNHQTYGVPSRVCEYFLFSRNKTIENGFQSLSSLNTYLNKLSKDRTALIGDFNGSWNSLSFYLQSYASNYDTSDLDNVLSIPIDKISINSLESLYGKCNFQGSNKCINKYYHNEAIGTIEHNFANNKAYNALGFSEAAFYIKLYSSSKVYATPIPYGYYSKPLIYTDIYVKNNATCKDQSCSSNFKKFTDYMNLVATQLWINFSDDLPRTMPPRYLLSAIKEFYNTPRVKADALYAYFSKNLSISDTFPNNITEDDHHSSNQTICSMLEEVLPEYSC